MLLALWEHGTAGIAEERDGLRAFFDDEVTADSVCAVAGLYGATEPRAEPACEPSFERENWDPILIRKRFYVAPPWVTTAVPAGRLRLEIDAATAFGTGRHETTQLCLEALDLYLTAGSTVIDVGCGSGILSLAAKLLGARRVFSCDIHADALENAGRHVSTPLFIGSADALETECADLVLANISAAVLDRLAYDLKRITKPKGLVVASGFIREKLPECYSPKWAFERGEWLCWVCRPSGVRVSSREHAREGLSHVAEWWL